jgi:hypothetical protein
MASKHKKIDARSGSSFDAAFSLFTMPPTDVAIEKSQYRELHLLSSLSNEGPFEFRLLSDTHWIQMNKIWLFMEMRIEIKDATGWRPIAATDPPCAPENNIVHTFIRQLKMNLNNTEIFDSNPLYSYRAYIETELLYPTAVKEQFFGVSGYTPTTTNTDTEKDPGFLARAKPYATGHYVQLMGNLHFDLANQPRLMLNNSDLTITLFRQPDSFCLRTYDATNKEYRINLHSMRLYVKVVDAFNSVNLGVVNALSKNPALYPITRVEMKSLYIDEGRMQVPENHIFTDLIPNRITLAMVRNDAFVGSWKHSPYNFQSFDVKQVSVSAGNQIYPAVPMDLDFTENKYARALLDMYDGLDFALDERSNGITMEMFRTSWTFFVISLTPSMENRSSGFNLVRQGTTSANILFNKPVKKPGVILLIYAEFNSVLSIDQQRIVTIDGR